VQRPAIDGRVLTFVGVLVEATESVYLLITNICDRGVDQAGGLGADCRDDLWLVALNGRLSVACRARRHEERIIVVRAGGGGAEGESL
jgi:hypothetical protein